jgi:multidrug efflux pump subunit AcrA (membrane-fusion protein)
MNKLAKIAPIVVILACGGSLFFAFKLNGVKTKLTTEKEQSAKDAEAAHGQLAQAQQQLQQDAALLQKAQNDVAAANANMLGAQAALADKTKEADAAKAQVTELGQQLQETKTKLAGAEDTLQKIQEATKSEDMQNIGQIREKLVALGEENKVLSGQLTSMRDENTSLKQKLAEKTETPVGVRGRVSAVQPSWGFLVLDIGQNNRVQLESYFIVYRNTKMIGKAQVVQVNPTTSIAELLPEYSRGTVRPGDMVIH